MTPSSRSRAVRVPIGLGADPHILFLALLKQHRIATPQPEWPFAATEGRRFRMDYAWPDVKVAIECEGGVWSRGSHGRGTGIMRDMEKGNLAAVMGWTVIRRTPKQLASVETVDLLHRAFLLKTQGTP